jgi:hypothetical protein
MIIHEDEYWSQKLQLLRMASLDTHQLQLQEMLNSVLRDYPLNVLYTGLGNEMERFQSMTKIDTWIVYLFIGYEWKAHE